jgi:hypothetical protein
VIEPQAAIEVIATNRKFRMMQEKTLETANLNNDTKEIRKPKLAEEYQISRCQEADPSKKIE